MKIALCFVISYEHILNKEEIWKQWIEPNKDIINVYFYYKDREKIKSPWILKHALPPQYIHETSYYHVIPAYLSLMQFALTHDVTNQWLCFLTDSCCPIISPQRFRALFYKYWNNTIMSWKPAWWNVTLHKRANLALLPQELRLANDPWFVIKRENAMQILHFTRTKQDAVKTICDGGLANESLFAIILNGYKQLIPSETISPFKNLFMWSFPMREYKINKQKMTPVISGVTHLADWSRMASATSPHIFKDANETDIEFLEENLKKNKCAMFVRKVAPEFPNEVLEYYIYQHNREKDEQLAVTEPFVFMFKRWLIRLWCGLYYFTPLFFNYQYKYDYKNNCQEEPLIENQKENML
jgi:hypothetical protein